MHTTRKKNFNVKITDNDRYAVRRSCPSLNLVALDKRAVARAAGRAVFAESKSTAEALNSLTSGIPCSTLHAWMKDELKKAA